jgi:dynein heavy chain
MNPNYAGRVDLPDNLKALFRPVAMMIPEYTKIAEISLYSYGFQDARELAKKIVLTNKLCSEQLSSQYHYDYGMRAVKSVLTASKNMKFEAIARGINHLSASEKTKTQLSQNHEMAMSQISQNYAVSTYSSEETEDMLILRAIKDVNLPKFLADDIPLFEGIIGDLFPGAEYSRQTYQRLRTKLSQVFKQHNHQEEPQFITKIIQLYDMIKCRHGLMLVGPAYSGKTTAYKLLRDAITKVAKQPGTKDERPVQTRVINPKSITLNELYGSYDPIS